MEPIYFSNGVVSVYPVQSDGEGYYVATRTAARVAVEIGPNGKWTEVPKPAPAAEPAAEPAKAEPIAPLSEMIRSGRSYRVSVRGRNARGVYAEVCIGVFKNLATAALCAAVYRGPIKPAAVAVQSDGKHRVYRMDGEGLSALFAAAE
jgi:hypothetical protein